MNNGTQNILKSADLNIIQSSPISDNTNNNDDNVDCCSCHNAAHLFQVGTFTASASFVSTLANGHNIATSVGMGSGALCGVTSLLCGAVIKCKNYFTNSDSPQPQRDACCSTANCCSYHNAAHLLEAGACASTYGYGAYSMYNKLNVIQLAFAPVWKLKALAVTFICGTGIGAISTVAAATCCVCVCCCTKSRSEGVTPPSNNHPRSQQSSLRNNHGTGDNHPISRQPSSGTLPEGSDKQHKSLQPSNNQSVTPSNVVNTQSRHRQPSSGTSSRSPASSNSQVDDNRPLINPPTPRSEGSNVVNTQSRHRQPSSGTSSRSPASSNNQSNNHPRSQQSSLRNNHGKLSLPRSSSSSNNQHARPFTHRTKLKMLRNKSRQSASSNNQVDDNLPLITKPQSQRFLPQPKPDKHQPSFDNGDDAALPGSLVEGVKYQTQQSFVSISTFK